LFVGGEQVVADGELANVDIGAVRRRAITRASELWSG
jgi:hypothetical protein